MPEKAERRKSHGKWFQIKSGEGSTYRILRFSGNLAGDVDQEDSEIVLDWPAWLELWGYADDIDGQIELNITKVPWWKYPLMVRSHPDPTTRLAGELALLSVALGILSIVFALLA